METETGTKQETEQDLSELKMFRLSLRKTRMDKIKTEIISGTAQVEGQEIRLETPD